MFSPETLRELYAHMEWADAKVWSVALKTDGAPSDGLLSDRLFHVHQTQGILLEGPTVFGNAAGYVAVRTGGMLLAAIGRPERSAIQAARRIVTHGAELVCPDSSAAHLQSTLGPRVGGRSYTPSDQRVSRRRTHGRQRP